MPYFLCRMTLPRADFLATMSEDEKRVMKAHGDYLQSLAELGSIICHGLVDDPKGGWGLSIFDADGLDYVRRLTASDPIILDDIGALGDLADQRAPHEDDRGRGMMRSVDPAGAALARR